MTKLLIIIEIVTKLNIRNYNKYYNFVRFQWALFGAEEEGFDTDMTSTQKYNEYYNAVNQLYIMKL